MNDIQAKYESCIEAFTRWAQEQSDIRAARIIGSRTHNKTVSRWVDLDIEFYTTNSLYYRTNRTWIDEFIPTWLVCYDDSGDTLSHWWSRFESWVLFTTLEGGIAVDFMVMPHIKLVWSSWKSRFKGITSPVPAEYILVDKDGRLAKWGTSAYTTPPLSKPSEKEYLWRVHEFWGVVDRGTRYLGRGFHIEARRELGEGLKKHTKMMMLWHAGAKQNWRDGDWRPHHIDQWANPEHLEALQACYARYDVEDVKRATHAIMQLFDRIAIEVAEMLNYTYPRQKTQLIATWTEAQFEMIT